MATKLAGSSKSGWYCYAELKPGKIVWHHEKDRATNLSKTDIDLIKYSFKNKKGKIYKTLIKDMEEDSLEFIIKKRKKL